MYYLNEKSKLNLEKFIKKEGKNVYYFIPELDRWVNSKYISKYLSNIELTPQIWYDKYILEIHDKSQRPICQVDECSCEIEFDSISKGYSKGSCSNPDHKKIIYNKNKARIISKESNIKRSNSLKENYKYNPDLSKRIGESIRKAYLENPEKREIQAENTRKRYEDPEVRKRASEVQIERYKDINERLKTSEAMKRSNLLNPESIKKRAEGNHLHYVNDPDARIRLSNSHIARYMNPTEKMKNRIKNSKMGTSISIYSEWEGKMIHLDSKWELDFVNFCKEIKVKSLNREDISIKYFNSKYNRNAVYLPDFLLNNHYLIEIKPNCFLDDQTNIDKFLAADEYCRSNGLEFIVITEDWLYPKGNNERMEFYGKLNI